MRQAGVLAAAALYALEHHVDRLAEDHRNAQIIAHAVADTQGLELSPAGSRDEHHLDRGRSDCSDPPRSFAAALKEQGVLVNAVGPRMLRACTHLDVSAAQAERAAEFFAGGAGAARPPSGYRNPDAHA